MRVLLLLMVMIAGEGYASTVTKKTVPDPIEDLEWNKATPLDTLELDKAEPLDTLELQKDSLVTLYGPINRDSAADVVKSLLKPRDEESIYFFLHSPGGSIIAGESIIAAMKASGKDIKCIASYAASMAFVILQYCDERLLMPNSIIMQHVSSYGLNQAPSPNNNSIAAFLMRIVEKLDYYQADRIGISYDYFKTTVRDDLWLHGTDGVGFKAADKVVNLACSNALLKSRQEINLGGYNGIVYKNGCPMILDFSRDKKGKRRIKNMRSLFTTNAEEIKALNMIDTK